MKFRSILLALTLTLPLSGAGVQVSSGGNVSIGNDVTIETGDTVENAVSIGGNVTVYGHVLNDVVAVGGAVYLGPDSRVGGDVVSIGGNIEKHPLAVIKGSETEIDALRLDRIIPLIKKGDYWGYWLGAGVLFGVGFILLGFLLALLFPGVVATVSHKIRTSPLPSGLVGVAGTVLTLPATILLAVSLIGIPIIPVFLFTLMLIGLAGYISISFLLGDRAAESLNRSQWSLASKTLLGLVIMWFIGFVPFIGSVVKFFIALVGFGGALIAFYRHIRK